MATQSAAAARRVAGELAEEKSALRGLGAELHAGIARAREEAAGQEAREGTRYTVSGTSYKYQGPRTKPKDFPACRARVHSEGLQPLPSRRTSMSKPIKIWSWSSKVT